MLISKKVDIKIKKGNINRYNKLEGKDNITVGDIIQLDVNMLTKGSNCIVEIKCDICDNIYKRSYKRYMNTIGNHCSRKCSFFSQNVKAKDIYGVNNIAQIPKIKESIQKSMLERYGSEQYLASKDAVKKRKETLIERYGVDNPLKSNIVKEKLKKTNLKRYGTEYSLQSKEIRDKIKITSLERYGFDNPAKSDIIKNKVRETNIEKFGHGCPLLNNDIQEKSKNTLMYNHGVSSPLKSDKIKKKVKETNLKRYGTEYGLQNKEVRDKIKNTVFKKYGVNFITQSDEFKNNNKIINLKRYGTEYPTSTKKIRNKVINTVFERYNVINVSQAESVRKDNYSICKSKDYLYYEGNGHSVYNCNKGHTYSISSIRYTSRLDSKLPACLICHPIQSGSIAQTLLMEFIQDNYSGDIITDFRDKFEIDVYLPELNIGFEFNGLIWHSSKYKEKNYHIDKTNFFKERGVDIVHIWEDDWKFKQDIVKSIILDKIGIYYNTISTEKNIIIEIIDNKIADEFLTNNHLEGKDESKVKLGLYYNEELLSIMTFMEINNKSTRTISRHCNILNTYVKNGVDKLLKYFIKTYNPNKIITYINNDNSNDNLYKGFEFIYNIKPNYQYFHNNKRVNKNNFQNEKIEYLTNKNIYKIWDTGKSKYELIL
jgi:hypothetical protein